MGYVQAGYSIVLGILFLYGLQLVWRRRRLNRAVARVVATDAAGVGTSAPMTASTAAASVTATAVPTATAVMTAPAVPAAPAVSAATAATVRTADESSAGRFQGDG
jgi:hypothetical protein